MDEDFRICCEYAFSSLVYCEWHERLGRAICRQTKRRCWRKADNKLAQTSSYGSLSVIACCLLVLERMHVSNSNDLASLIWSRSSAFNDTPPSLLEYLPININANLTIVHKASVFPHPKHIRESCNPNLVTARRLYLP